MAGYYRGWWDPVISRVSDVMLAFPFLIVAVGMAAIFGPSLRNVVVALGVAAIPCVVRVTRGEALALREQEFVRAAVANGAGDRTILSRHLLPNMAGTLLVQATVWIPTAIIGEAVLSFLGLGVQPPTPSWGSMLSAAQPFISIDAWLALWPGLAIFLATLSFNLLGDGLRDVLDPKTQRDSASLLDHRLWRLPAGALAMSGDGLRAPRRHGRFDTDDGAVHAVDRVSFDLRRGETLAIVGESGCGKSVTTMSLLGLLPPTANVEGEARFNGGVDLIGAPRGRAAADPRPRDLVRLPGPDDVAEPGVHRGAPGGRGPAPAPGMSKAQARERTIELLELVGIPSPERRVDEYPHQLSGGMRQRVMIAMAIACEPKVLIADEPTTALDVTIQAAVLDVLRELRERLGMAIVLITHDLGVVADIADRVVIMYAGQKVEEAPVSELFAHPQHPYTIGLLARRRGPPTRCCPRAETATARAACPRPSASGGASSRSRAVSRPCTGRPTTARSPTAARAPTTAQPLRGAAARGGPPRAPRRLLPPGRAPRPGGPAGVSDPILEVSGLVKHFDAGRGGAGGAIPSRGARGRGRLAAHRAGRGRRPRRRVGQRQVDGRQLHPAPARADRRDDPPARDRHHAPVAPRDAAAAARHAHGLPGPVLVAQPADDERGDRRRAAAAARPGGRPELERRVAELFDQVGLDPELRHRYPHELSGGQRQRIGLARALSVQPSLLVADEPVSALDVSVQAAILNLLADLQEDMGFACLFITHDLSIVEHFCDRVIVMYLGRVVETGTREQIFTAPQHPYTQALLSAVVVPDPQTQRTRSRIVLDGDLPSPIDPPSGCAFRTRCPIAHESLPKAEDEIPELRDVDGDGHLVACHLARRGRDVPRIAEPAGTGSVAAR